MPGIVFVLLLAMLLGSCAGGPPRQTEDLCAVFSEKFGWRKTALKQQAKWDVPMYTALAIMAQESSFRATAKPPRKFYLGILPGQRLSSAYGYAQAIDGTWNQYLKDTGSFWRRRDDFADALDFINWYITRTGQNNGIDRSDTYRLYLNYHEGWHGFRQGAYKNKRWLLETATRVADRADRYKSQYRACQAS